MRAGQINYLVNLKVFNLHQCGRWSVSNFDTCEASHRCRLYRCACAVYRRHRLRIEKDIMVSSGEFSFDPGSFLFSIREWSSRRVVCRHVDPIFLERPTDVRVVSPNIIGEIASTNGLGVGNGNPSMSGALSMVYVDQRWAGFADAAGKYLRSISFDASGSSATYGSSATVQPKSVRALACIKI